MGHFLDTNILLYSISKNPDETRKYEIASQLLDNDAGALSIQVLQEFYVQATRVSRPDPISHDMAAALMKTWTRFRIQSMTLDTLNQALQIRKTHGFSFWDSTIIAAASALRCDRIYTEDLNHGQAVQGITIINPFR